MNFETFTAQYGGWIGLALYFIYHQLWPFVTKRSVTEQEFEQGMEERRVVSGEKVAEAVQIMSTNMVLTNERIANLQSNQLLMMQKQNDTHDMLASAISDLKQAVGTNKRKQD